MSATLTNRGLLRAVLVAFALLLAYRFLAAVVATLLLLAVGVLLAVALSGPVEALRKRYGVPRPVSVALLSLGVLAALGLGGYLLLPVLTTQAQQLAATLPDALSQIAGRIREIASGFGISLGGSGGISAQTLARIGRSLLGGILGIFGSLASFLTGLIVVLFIPLYLAALPKGVVDWVVRLFPPGKRDRTREVLSHAHESLLRWLVGRLFSMFVVGVLSTIALYVIGVPGALFLGIFSGLVAFVPLIGSIVGAIPPLILALVGNPVEALYVLLAYVAIQQIESNLLTPLVMQQAASIHPAVVIAAVTVVGAAFGILGALLAVPAAVVAGVLVDELWFRRLEGEPEAAE